VIRRSLRATLLKGPRSKAAVLFSSGRFLLVAGLVGCTASAEQVRPPEDQFFFPTGAAVSPDDTRMFVANANSELRYDSGMIAVLDLALVDQISADWTVAKTVPDGCEQDTDHIETLTCDETRFIMPHTGARIGNFATDVAIQDRGGGNLRLIVPTRGDPSVAWVDFDGQKLSCNTSAEGFALCDETHRLAYVHNDPDLAVLPDEPFNVFADSANGYAIVTHLTTGAVTLINSPSDGNATISDVATGVFAADPLTGLRGSTGVSGRNVNGNDIIYVGSRSEDRIQTFTVGRPVNDADPFLIPSNFFFLDTVGGNAGSSSDTRGMAFSPSGDRLYLINRRPPSLQVFDTSLKATGFPANMGIGATDICRGASTLSVLDSGDGDRVYITCFQDGQVYIVDPRGQSQVEDILTVGRGPYAVVSAPTRKKVYVTNFLEDTIAVIDVAPGSPTRNRVVLRIGEVKPP
jgi:DNA-binding beta-propeller fold protein YncE